MRVFVTALQLWYCTFTEAFKAPRSGLSTHPEELVVTQSPVDGEVATQLSETGDSLMGADMRITLLA
ncbi:hypothetical protein [Pseudomonas amygdali]|uniref:Secreted protein n=1 Tax=Pseudomonas amygdali pv. lachrymans TaxID=53707 RepID=A0ABR5KTI7_PSEAV|nr:hypothetical protein [Pseudomonas amygdali]KPC17174.1 Unknown protein sequence [Pseudomonas amygdali pv. lachrymans]KPC18133.1 Unknown protein sequence [Pseudomonas amygdali pv. lachrymans]RMT05709.1 hypothetical protein ALP54_102821 [Pseudomonas amygdali pv. lachrymans]